MMKPRTSLAFLFALLLAVGTSVQPATAQDGDDDFPTLDFSTNVMQGAQYLRTDDTGTAADDAEFGFQRVRYNLGVSAQFHERISATIDLGHEPNDFGTGGASFSPAVDFVALDLMLNDVLTLRLGTPVTSLFNFRGYSDGAAVQGNPLIGNSPIDFITAETGIQLIGSSGNASFDLTATSPTFFETNTPGTGLTLVGKASFQANEMLSFGAGIAQGTSRSGVTNLADREMNLIVGDGENYSLPGFGGQPNRYTHARIMPGLTATLLQADARAMAGPLTLDLWGGYGFEGDTYFQGQVIPGEDASMWWGGATAKLDATEQFFFATRASFADNTSDWASDLDNTSIFRLQVGVGYSFWDRAMFKVEFVTQDEGVNSPGQVGDNWYGALTELSVGF